MEWPKLRINWIEEILRSILLTKQMTYCHIENETILVNYKNITLNIITNLAPGYHFDHNMD